MKKLRIYVDTSVIGGCFDVEFAAWSNALIEDFRSGRFRLVLSDVTAAEVARAPVQVRDLHAELLPLAEILPVTEESLALLENYQAHQVLDPRFRNDMLHIALATVAGADVLVSWNFQHVVRLDKIQQFNGINVETGYKSLAIYSPREVTTHGREE
jgi:predicted nucleic acid-binding protein